MKTKKLITSLLALSLAGLPLLAETTAPSLKDGAMPEYPDQARSTGVEGTVYVEALIDENGNVFAAEIVESPAALLEAPTLAAIHSWKFEPATKDGKAIMQVVRIPVKFSLLDPVESDILRSHDRAIASR